MSRFSLFLVILCLICLTVSAVSVDVSVEVGQHHKHHDEHPQSAVDEADFDEAAATSAVNNGVPDVPCEPGKTPEKSHVPYNSDDFLQVGSANGPNAKCQVNVAGTNLVKSFEGFRSHWYYDSVHVRTIGYGCTFECAGMKSITEPQAAAKLRQLLSTQYGACVRNKVTHHLTGNQFSALVSLVYNTGCGSMSGGLLSALNKGSKASMNTATKHIMMWDHAGGRVLSGLLRRRKAEVKLFNTPSALC